MGSLGAAVPPRYLVAVAELLAAGDLDPTVSHEVTVHHEADCLAWDLRGPCECLFDLVIHPAEGTVSSPPRVNVVHAEKVRNVHNGVNVRNVRNVDLAETFPFSKEEAP